MNAETIRMSLAEVFARVDGIVAAHGHVLTPGCYVRAEIVGDEKKGFEARMQALTERLGGRKRTGLWYEF